MMFRLPRVLRRIITIVVGVALVFFIGVGIAAYFIKSDEPPSVQDAPWLIQTSSRIYYAEEISILPDGNPQIRNYYYSDGSRYNFVDEVFPLPKKLFGNVNVIRRSSQ